jgi:hypothetical protein
MIISIYGTGWLPKITNMHRIGKVVTIGVLRLLTGETLLKMNYAVVRVPRTTSTFRLFLQLVEVVRGTRTTA